MRHTELIALTRKFVGSALVPWPEFRAALIVGSVAHDEARADSDVDCVFIFDPFDVRIVPAEFVWHPDTGAFSTIFEVDAAAIGGLQVDAQRWSFEQFAGEDWPEPLKHELAGAIVLFDCDGRVGEVIREKTRYPAEVRTRRIAAHLALADRQLAAWRLRAWIDRGGEAAAHDQLTVVLEELIRLLHAYNAVWLPWRYRWLISAGKLPWVPDGFAETLKQVVAWVEPAEASLIARREALQRILDAIRSRLSADGFPADADEVFAASHAELGYAHNLDAWKEAHRQLLEERGGRA